MQRGLRASVSSAHEQDCMQVSDEDDAAIAIDLADKLEAAIASELVLPQEHGLTPNQNSLLQAEIE